MATWTSNFLFYHARAINGQPCGAPPIAFTLDASTRSTTTRKKQTHSLHLGHQHAVFPPSFRRLRGQHLLSTRFHSLLRVVRSTQPEPQKRNLGRGLYLDRDPCNSTLIPTALVVNTPDHLLSIITALIRETFVGAHSSSSVSRLCSRIDSGPRS